MAPLIGLNHWMLHQKKLAEEFDEILNLTPYYDPVRLVETQTDLTFFAPLTTDVSSRVGNYAPDFQRNSNGLYRAPMQSEILIAGDNVARHEYLDALGYTGILMEQAKTNICENFNANPDAGFLNMSITAGSGTLTREDQSVLLAQAGLGVVCSSGLAFKVDAPTDVTDVTVEAPAGVAGNFVLSAFVYCEQGTGSLALNNVGAESTEIPFVSNAGFERIVGVNSVTLTTGRWRIRAEPGSVVYFVLNQLEEGLLISSPIITEGATATRSSDTLTWPLIDGLGREIVNQAEGMAALEWRPDFDAFDLAAGVNETKILMDFDPIGSNGETLAYQNNDSGLETFRAYAGAGSPPSVTLQNPLTKDELYLLMLRWGSGEYQVGYKSKGVVTWGGTLSFGGWNSQAVLRLCSLFDGGAYEPMGSSTVRNVRVWQVDNGTAWLEDFFSGVAN